MVTLNSSMKMTFAVTKRKNFLEYYYILGCFLPSGKNINDQRKVTKSFQDMVKILHGKNCVSSFAYLGCTRIVQYEVFLILYIKKKLSTEKLILNTKITVAEDSD